MATRLSGVFIPVSLDTSKAIQQLDAMERKLGQDEAAAKRVNKEAKNATANAAVAKKMGVGGGGSGSGQESGVVSKLAGLASRTPAGGLAGTASRVAGSLIPGSAVAAAKFAGGVALGYAAVSLTAQKLPELTYALEKIAGLESRLQGLQVGLESVRRGFSTFESGITTLPKSMNEVSDLVDLSFRLGGSPPNIPGLFKQVHLANVYETELDKKFDQFRHKEVYAGAGESFRQYASRTADILRKEFGLKGNN